MFRRNLFPAFIVAIGLISCGSPKPTDPNYVAWVRDYNNGMHVRQAQNDLEYDVQFQPAEYAWIVRNGQFDQAAFEADQGEFKDMQYFILNIHSRDGADVITHLADGNQHRTGELLYYFSYRFQNDIFLQEGTNQKAVALYHYEQHGTKSFVLGFQKGGGPSADVTLTLNTSVLDSSPIRIKVSTDPKAL